MLGNTDPNSSEKGYAQIGIMFDRNGCNCMFFFYEWDRDGDEGPEPGHFDDFGGTPVEGLVYKMRVVWNNDAGQDGKIHMQHDFNGDGVWSDQAVTTFDPGVWWSWRMPIFAEETAWKPSDLMGSSGSRLRFDDSLVRQGGAGSSFISPLFHLQRQRVPHDVGGSQSPR
jgi:hypothetical protein